MENVLGSLKYLVDQFGLIDFLDILFVSVMIYYVVKFIRDRRASKLAIGVFLILLILLLSEVLGMRAVDFLLSNIVQVGLIALIIVFQPELRSALEKVGGSSFKALKNSISLGFEPGQPPSMQSIPNSIRRSAILILSITVKLLNLF